MTTANPPLETEPVPAFVTVDIIRTNVQYTPGRGSTCNLDILEATHFIILTHQCHVDIFQGLIYVDSHVMILNVKFILFLSYHRNRKIPTLLWLKYM
jgi:hypothetical protein